MTAPNEPKTVDPAVRILDEIKRRQRPLIIGIAIIIVGVGAIWYMSSAAERRENFAMTLLTNARTAAASGNVALAITDLSDLALSHRGTTASEEAQVLLAQLRISEGQAGLAVQELNGFIDRGPSDQFRAPAHGLLAVALEQTGAAAESASEYIAAADAAWYDFLEAQYLLEAARVLVATGDTTQAVSVYERIMNDLSETDMVMEARLRLSEILKSDIDNR